MIVRPRLKVTVLCLLLTFGCDGETSAGSGVGDAGAAEGGNRESPRSTGPGDWTPGDYPPELKAQTYLEIAGVEGQLGESRKYKVHVPPRYDPTVPMPVVFCFHGLQQNAVMFCVDGAGMVSKADEAGFILVMPNGHENRWNAGACCQGAPVYDEMAFVRALFAELGRHVNVDLARVYATGLSNGGFMSYRLACQAADIFAAVAPGSGAIGTNDLGWGNATSDFTECAPSEAVSVLDMHGTSDSLVPYALQAFSLELIARKAGCGATTTPAISPRSAGDTTCVSYAGCPKGIEITGCTVQGGGHVWFGSDSCGTGAGPAACSIVGANSTTLVNTDAAWDFFSRHSK